MNPDISLISVIGLGLCALIFLIILFTVVVKHGHCKSFFLCGGLLLLLGSGVVVLNLASESVGNQTLSKGLGNQSTATTNKELSSLITMNQSIELADHGATTDQSKIASDDLIAVASKIENKIEIGSESNSLSDAPDWIKGTENKAHKVFESEPYLGSVYDSSGKPVKHVLSNLTSQLSLWLAQEYKLTTSSVTNSPDTEENLVCIIGTNPTDLWNQFITKTHVVKNETSVGDTETLYVLVEKNSKNLGWLNSRNRAEIQAAEQSKTMRLATSIGGVVFLGLVSLYGFLASGGATVKDEA